MFPPRRPDESTGGHSRLVYFIFKDLHPSHFLFFVLLNVTAGRFCSVCINLTSESAFIIHINNPCYQRDVKKSANNCTERLLFWNLSSVLTSVFCWEAAPFSPVSKVIFVWWKVWMKKKGEKFEKVTLSDKKPVKWRKKGNVRCFFFFVLFDSFCCELKIRQ